MLCALGVVLLYVGVFVQVVDISVAVLASLLCVFAVIEYGKGAAWSVFAITSILSLLLLPNRSPAVMYAAFFGYYPILKERFERSKKWLSWLYKELTFNVALIVIVLIFKFVFAEFVDVPTALYVIGIILCEAVFVLYDVALTRLISIYIYRLRSRLKLK